MGGQRIPPAGPSDGSFDIEGYDESQRAEVHEFMHDGPTDGTILTDVAPDLGGDPLEEDGTDDELVMTDDEVGEEDGDLDSDEDEMEEDSLQEGFDGDVEDLDEELSDGDDVALRP
jgi:hypothetical protein